MRRLIRSLPTASGVLGIATCDKGLPATMLALAGTKDLPGVIVPGGVTLPARGAEDAGQVQSLGARFTHDLISLDYAADMGCRACGSSGGGCQFLGTAATSQVVAEALGLALPHSALAPSGEPVWLELASRSAAALRRLHARQITVGQILTDQAVENAMLVHAAFGGSTNLLLHIPAIAAAAGLKTPTVDDWIRVNRATPRLVDALPNGPTGYATAQVFMAGGVPEVMLHLRRMGLLSGRAMTATGETLDVTLDWWESSDRRRAARARLASAAAVDPDQVIMAPDAARRAGLTSTIVFPVGNLAPQGSVNKATAIDRSVIDEDGVYRHRGLARVFTDERDAIAAVKGTTDRPIREGDVIVLIGAGPSGTGMQETAQITTALRYLPWGKQIALLTDGRFSGFSSGACVGHIGPEALAGGPIGRVRDGDLIEIVIDRVSLEASIDLVGVDGKELSREEGAAVLRESIHRSAIVRIDFDASDSALQQKFRQPLRVGMLPHAVDGPPIHGVVDHQLFLRLAPQQLIDGKAGGFAENVPLRDVDGGEHAKVRASPGLVGDAIKHVLPQAVDFSGILAQDDRRQFLEGAAVGIVTRIRLADAHQALVGVQPHPHPVGRNPLDAQVGPKRTASTLVIFMGPTASAAFKAGSGKAAAPAALRNSLLLLMPLCMLSSRSKAYTFPSSRRNYAPVY
jgi:putative YjhG/YagF family dehydratase